MSRSQRPANRPRHFWLFALPECELPARVRCAGAEYELQETFKHDFFAATGLYRGPHGLAVLKLGRVNELFRLPTNWIGEFLTRRETRIYARAQGIVGVPALIGRVGRNGFMHAFVPGRPLGRDDTVSDTFFDELCELLRELHRREIAYVDLNKRQNILVGDDGRPYLIDFQISLDLPPRGWRRAFPLRWLLRRLQAADWYHALKHKRRLRPDLLSTEERERVERLSIWIRLHRFFARPLTNLRRRALRRLQAGERVVVAGSSAK